MAVINKIKCGVLSLLLLSGCSQNPAPVNAPIPPPPQAVSVRLGINDGFHGPLPVDIVRHICDWGGDKTVRSPVLTVTQVYQILVSTQPCNNVIHNLILVEGNDLNLVANIADAVTQNNVRAVELGNELELNPLQLSPQQSIDYVVAGYNILRKAGYKGDIISGGVYTVDNEMVTQRLQPLVKACPGCIIGVHWYQDKGPTTQRLLTNLGAPIAITECGKPSRNPAEDQQQFDEIQNCINAGKTVGAKYIIIYQRPSGPTSSDLDNFGVQRSDGSWKPSDSLFKDQ